MAASERLHVGITPWSYDWERASLPLTDQAERADRLGFGSFWLPESHFTGRTANPAPLLLLAAVAARTQRIRIATTSFLLPVRHPLQVAEEVAVLDRISRGRVILGVGRGFRKALFSAFDVPVKRKRDLFEAALAVMRDAWAGKPVAPEDDGSPPVILSPLPLQRPHPPIWVAAFGPKALAQAGRLGLPYLCSPIEPLPILEQNHAAHREALSAAHGELALPVPLMRTVFVHRDPAVLRRVREGLEAQAEALARAPSAAIRRAGAASLESWAIVGEPAAVADGLARYRERLGMTHLVARTQIPGAGETETQASLEYLAELHAED